MDLPFPAREDETGGLELPVPSAKQKNSKLLLHLFNKSSA